MVAPVVRDERDGPVAFDPTICPSTAGLAFMSVIPLLWATCGAAALASRLLASRRGRPGAAHA